MKVESRELSKQKLLHLSAFVVYSWVRNGYDSLTRVALIFRTAA
jgi:hypothetical protein